MARTIGSSSYTVVVQCFCVSICSVHLRTCFVVRVRSNALSTLLCVLRLKFFVRLNSKNSRCTLEFGRMAQFCDAHFCLLNKLEFPISIVCCRSILPQTRSQCSHKLVFVIIPLRLSARQFSFDGVDVHVLVPHNCSQNNSHNHTTSY